MAGLFISLIVIAGLFAAATYLAPKGWRTRVFNWASIAIAGAHQFFVELQALPWETAFSPKVSLAITVGIIAANMVLREITTTPPGQADA